MFKFRHLIGIVAKTVLWLAVFLQFIPPPCYGGNPEDYEAREIFYNVLAIVQNSYIYPTDNWELLNGAIKGLQNKTGGELLASRQNDKAVAVGYREAAPLEFNKSEIDNNAFMLMESLARLFLMVAGDADSAARTDIIYAAVDGMIKTLDPHSSLINPGDFQDMQARNDGVFRGIGIELTIKDKMLTVVSPFEGTPAFKMGLKAMDRIVKIDNVPTAGMDIMDAIGRLRGPKGSRVTLTIMRSGWDEPEDIAIARDILPLHSIRHKILEPGFAYIRITSFLSKTREDLQNTLTMLNEEEKLKGLILDLRNNPGGLLDQAIDICDIFLDQGIIVTTKGRDRQLNRTFTARPDYEKYDFPIVVLVNAGSASGTEIVAASLQENKRSLVVGTQTFGKGSIQTVFSIKDGAALRLTTAKFYTPSGYEIQESGIYPDILADDQQALEIKREVDLNSGIIVDQSNFKKDIPEVVFTKNENEDPVMNFALEILKRTTSNQQAELLRIAKQIISEKK